jgi:hypothetical protein
LLLLSLLVQLQLIEGLEHCLHQLVLCSQELLHLWVVVVVGIIGLSVASLTVEMVVPRVHHLRNFWRRDTKIFQNRIKPQTICCDFYLPLFKR